MSARAIWKGELKIGSASLPVKLYSAVEDRKIRFHVLQSKTKERVKQQIVTDEKQKVGKEEIRKGYEIEPGTFVVLETAELDALKPKESRTILFPRFIPVDALGLEWYERPYYLGPDGNEDDYFALASALNKREVLGIAQWAMRGKAYVGALRAEGDYLVLIKLRYSEEVLSARDLPAPGGRDLSEKELKMAEELVNALDGKFQPKDFRDEYRERLAEFLEAKAKGKHPRLPQIKERRAAGSLDQQLAKSLAAIKRGKEKKVA
jgi:DNA end-binding protein Ku